MTGGAFVDVDLNLDVDESVEHVCQLCHLVHWTATPLEISCDVHREASEVLRDTNWNLGHLVA